MDINSVLQVSALEIFLIVKFLLLMAVSSATSDIKLFSGNVSLLINTALFLIPKEKDALNVLPDTIQNQVFAH